MIYLKLTNGARVIILEPGNLQQIQNPDGVHGVKTPDGEVLIYYTPDEAWMSEQLLASDGSLEALDELLLKSKTRTPVMTRPKKPTLTYRRGEKAHDA